MSDFAKTILATTIQAAIHGHGYTRVTCRIDDDNMLHLEGQVPDDDDEAKVVGIADDFDVAGLIVDLSYANVDQAAAAKAPVVPKIPQTTPGVELYTVKKGDSWWAITKRAYGDGNKWKHLKAANGSPKMLHPGHVLVLPPKDQLEKDWA